MLVEHFDIDLTVVVLSQDFFRVFLRVKGVHKNKRHIDVIGLKI